MDKLQTIFLEFLHNKDNTSIWIIAPPPVPPLLRLGVNLNEHNPQCFGQDILEEDGQLLVFVL